MSTTNFPPGVDALGRLFNAISGSYAKVSGTYAVVGLQSDAETSVVHPEYDPSITYAIPKNVNFDDFQTNANGRVETGTSISSYQSRLAVSAQVSARYAAYSGSVSGSWSNMVTATEEEYFATTFDTWSLYTLSFNYHNVDLTTTDPASSRKGICISDTLQDGFNALNANDTTGKAAMDFFTAYGTHVLTGLIAGGQTRQDYQGSQSNFTDEDDFQVCVEAKYDAGVGSAAFKSTVSGANTKHESSVSTNESIDVTGGSPSAINGLISNPSSETYSTWNKSIPNYPAFIDYTPDGGTIPVWMLCSDAEKKNYLEKAFNQLYGATPLATHGATQHKCKQGTNASKWNDTPSAPVRSWNAASPDEVLVGIGGNIDDNKHISKMVIISYSLSRDEYNVYYLGGANASTSWEAFYMAPTGYVITGLGVGEKSKTFEHLAVWYQKLNRQNMAATFLDTSEPHNWMGGSPSSSKKINPASLPLHGSGWCHGGEASTENLQLYYQPPTGQQYVINGVQLCSSNEQNGFINLVITQAKLEVLS
ncbi:MAG: hypothetical protein KDD67_03950 [Ignavibacteriae bacterium]|nr:hypothetical protein [Ignavibacteriota bacterium]MCB9215004.1 hypothetical protein [Ignavibacteria bacterium]